MQEVLSYPYPLWRGEKCNRLVVISEQGIGDSIQSARWLPLLKDRFDGEVTLILHKELVSLFRKEFPWAAIEAGPSTSPTTLPPADAWLPMMSLPVALSCDPLAAPGNWLAQRRRRRHSLDRAFAGPAKRIGICWAGNPAHESTHKRDVPLAAFLPLCERSDLSLFSLQVGGAASQLSELATAGLITDLGPLLTDMSATADQISSLDMVISCDSAVAHLSGSLDIPTILLHNPATGDWRWGHSFPANPWYPSLRVLPKLPGQSWHDLIRSPDLAPLLAF